MRATNTLEAGRVLRYHAAPTVQPQTVGHHSYGVAVLVLHLTEGQASAALLRGAILHDAGEVYTGDIPFTVKRDSQATKILFDQLEDIAYEKHLLPMPDLTLEEQAVLKLADTLEGLIWCAKTESPGGPVGSRWADAAAKGIRKFASVLGDDSPVIPRALSLIQAAKFSSNLYT